MTGPFRLNPLPDGTGRWLDPAAPVTIRFDGAAVPALTGDTVASALLANGIRLIGRSFKYHRPRGALTAGHDEPSALIDVIGPHGRDPNRLATTLDVAEGLIVESQNRWPSLRFDAMAAAGLAGRVLPAGFYYKTFMGPFALTRAWERVYEPLIRRAAGLGRLDVSASDSPAAHPPETIHDHADVLVVGAGASGLAAALALGRAGARVILAERDREPGGGTAADPRWAAWAEATLGALAALPDVTVLARTAVVSAYGHGVFGALEQRVPGVAGVHPGEAPERLRVIRARRVVIAAGAVERLVAFPDNDRPGTVLAAAALAHLVRHGVAVGRRPVFLVNNDEAYATVFAYLDAGLAIAAVADARADSAAGRAAKARGVDVRFGTVIDATAGRAGLTFVRLAPRGGGTGRWIDADALVVSGGHNPLTTLATQAGGRLAWDDGIAAFVPDLDVKTGRVAGAARGLFGLAAAARDGFEAGCAVAAELGLGDPGAFECPAEDAGRTPVEPLWEIRGRGKAFVDLQNDVTADDIRLAHREGYEHVEHMKRYTTHGMATDQGRVGGLVGSAILAEARGVAVAAVGTPMPRPFAAPVPFAALAGGEVGQAFKPKRRLPLHDWHAARGAQFALTGVWLRPLVYSAEPGWAPVLAEARAVRTRVGVTDVSTLGKIDVQGPDAAAFLDFVYANTFSTLPVGRARYGIMLREDGMMLDDGTTSRLGPEHFLVTTTTANTAAVLEHLEFQLQVVRPDLDVHLADVTDHWAQFAVAGPRARDVVARLVEGPDLAPDAFPFMAAAPARIAGVSGRLFRISFSGELAYELAVPARHALPVMQAILAAGEAHGIVPYGLDALNTLRIEKGHVTGAELNGTTTADDLGFGRMLKKSGDFVGRALAGRPGLADPERLQLVGVRPVDPTKRLRNGAHLVEPEARERSLGHVTSSTPSVEIEGWLGLALLSGGRGRIGTRLLAASPIHGEWIEVLVTSPHAVDPENARVRA
jgi:sarcosine oxidase subunit alpha